MLIKFNFSGYDSHGRMIRICPKKLPFSTQVFNNKLLLFFRDWLEIEYENIF